MFSTLKQGDTVHVLEKDKKLTYKTGQIVSVTSNYVGGMNMKVKADDLVYEFTKVPYNQSVADNGQVFISETKDLIVTELQKLNDESEAILNNRDYYENLIKDCKTILRQINPIYDKEVRRDEEIDLLKELINEMSQSLSEIKKLLQTNKNE